MKEKFFIKYTKVVEEEVSFNKYVAVQLQGLRKRKNLTQEEFATKIGLSRASVINMEAGRQQITLKNLFLICRELGIKSSDLLPF